MDVDTLLRNMAAANFCAVMAFGLLLVWALTEYVEWANKRPSSRLWCQQHGKPRHECRDEHRD